MPDHSRHRLDPTDTFVHRHLGSDPDAIAAMLKVVGADSLDGLVGRIVPEDIRLKGELQLKTLPADRSLGEHELLHRLRGEAERNQPNKSYLGMGYHGCITPQVILRNILENPGWYTQYTPYQAEIAQGRLEALLNFQTMVADLTGLSMANASLLDEATAAAEAMLMCYNIVGAKRDTFVVGSDVHPQTLAVVQTRAKPFNIRVVQKNLTEAAPDTWDQVFGLLVQYPGTDGHVADYAPLCATAKAHGAHVVCAVDLLACTVLRPPGEFGADIAVGSAQRFGVPMGYGGPHAAFLSTAEIYKRQMPGRVIGVSKDAQGKPALRMAMQTREQHIRREKASSNICTAQALLAIMASMYGVYHGPQGLRDIAQRVRALATALRAGLRELGTSVEDGPIFDTLKVDCKARDIVAAGEKAGVNLRALNAKQVSLALDETTSAEDIARLLGVFGGKQTADGVRALADKAWEPLPAPHARKSAFLSHPTFNSYHSEHEMLRYINRLRQRDLSLTHAMIPLGSCTMKLNATSEMVPVTWSSFCNMHPFAPVAQAQGYATLFETLSAWLAEITGFAAVSLQPNAGAQGEYAGLLVLRRYHESRGDDRRNICLIPVSAHGTNPASASMCGLKVVPVACDAAGNIDLRDLEEKAASHASQLAALMVTYPSTHGVFERGIRKICDIVHQHGGQVYLDGANMNAQVGLCRPGDYGADVCHLNLHKTFCIPHGGGGPGMGPIGVAKHLAPFLPKHPVVETGGEQGIGAVSAAPWGSAGILPISWVYIALMGASGLRRATQLAILNANYMARRLQGAYPVLYTGEGGLVAHEFILDIRPFKNTAGIEAEDVAKRLMDFGFHAPTMSFPVAGTLMVEPTESESKAELDRFCEAMLHIREEIRLIEKGTWPKDNNPLKHAPHTACVVVQNAWDRPYSRETAAYPLPWVRSAKFWPAVSRVDNAWGDRNLICTCPPMEAYTS